MEPEGSYDRLEEQPPMLPEMGECCCCFCVDMLKCLLLIDLALFPLWLYMAFSGDSLFGTVERIMAMILLAPLGAFMIFFFGMALILGVVELVKEWRNW